MGKFDLELSKLYSLIKSRIYLILFLISIISLIFVFLNLIKIDILLGLDGVPFLNFTFHTMVNLGTIFSVLFLPCYPLFFIILNNDTFTSLEKLSLLIVVNSSFYIIIGYVCYWTGLPLSGFYFFFLVVFSFLLMTLYIILCEKNKGSFYFLRSRNSTLQTGDLKKTSFFKKLITLIPLNGFLLIVFITLIGFLNIVKTSIFLGTDPWLHILNSKIITDINILPLEGYHAELGLNIFGAVIHFFSGISHTMIPKYFPFYTFFLSGLIFYNILIRIFKNRNLAFFGVFLLEFSSLGFSMMMVQYWPSGSALIKCLIIFFLLYVRLQTFTQVERPTKKQIYSKMFYIYVLITIIFVSAVLTHVITTIFFLFSFIFVYIVYFLKDYKRGIDLIFLIGLFGIFIILNVFSIGSGHFWFFIPLNLPWYLLLLVGSGGILVGFVFFWRLQKSINFTRGRYKSVILGKEKKNYKKIEDSIIIPLIFSTLVLFNIVFSIVNLTYLNLEIISIFLVNEIILIISFAIWGLYLFQKKPKGKPLFLWGLCLFVFLLIGFVFNILILSNMIWQRILYLSPPIIVIGFVSYLYKLIKIKAIGTLKMKAVILSIIIFSLFTTFISESTSFKVFTLNRRDTSLIQWYSENTQNKNVIITEFGWTHAFKYFYYPFENKTAAFQYEENFYFLKSETDLFPPSNHINESGINLLKEIKKEYNTEVYLTFVDDYIINKGFDLFGELTEEEIEQYYNLKYINKIYSAKTNDGEETPLFWVI